jgi:hypothetical protein
MAPFVFDLNYDQHLERNLRSLRFSHVYDEKESHQPWVGKRTNKLGGEREKELATTLSSTKTTAGKTDSHEMGFYKSSN